MLLEELLVYRPAGGKGRMEIWTLAWDSNSNGTGCSVHMTERGCFEELIKDYVEPENREEAFRQLDHDGEEGYDFWEWFDDNEREPLDTFSIESQPIEVPGQSKALADALKAACPWLGTDEEISGADAIEQIAELYDSLVEDQLSHRGRNGFCAKCAGDCLYDSDGQPKAVKP